MLLHGARWHGLSFDPKVEIDLSEPLFASRYFGVSSGFGCSAVSPHIGSKMAVMKKPPGVIEASAAATRDGF